MLKELKKTIAFCLIGFGVGTIIVLLLPVKWWLVISGVIAIVVGISWIVT